MIQTHQSACPPASRPLNLTQAQDTEFEAGPSVRIPTNMLPSRPLRLAAPALAAALLLAPALRLVCDAVCAQPPVPAAGHCAGGDPGDPAHGNSAGEHGKPDGCRHSADIVFAKTLGGPAAGSPITLAPAELGPAFAGDRLAATGLPFGPHLGRRGAARG